MPGPELYARYHRLIHEFVRSVEPGTDWQTALGAQIDRFEADASALDPESARTLREELCAQLEHEALHSARPLTSEILFAAVKRLELGGWAAPGRS
ncbi:MAG: hypothetical protein ACFCUQ_09605 [Kiloniellales bacterium]